MAARRVRSPGIVYSALALALVIVLATVALTSRQPPPPTIAEFAPQAVEQIEEAPEDQTSTSGQAVGTGGADGSPPTPATVLEQEVIDVPRVRRCIGDPPRQTEDPQSPPCVPYWEGDNGGATARGVTADEIRVVLPTCENARKRVYDALEKFFNRRFEFYGRQMRFICGREDNGGSGQEQMIAEARGHFEEHEPFAASRYFNAVGTPYNNEMARLGVVSVTNAVLDPTEIDDLHLWSYWMAADEMFANMAEWACRRLAGREAVHAGQAALRETERRFGIIIETGYTDDPTTTDVLEEGLAACGAPVVERSVNEFAGDQTQVHRIQTIMLRMKEADVTTLFCFCHLYQFGPFQAAASIQSYFPEWITSTYGFGDLDPFIKLGGNPPEQMENTFGVSLQPRQLPLAAEPWWWAVKEVDPGYTSNNTGSSVAGGVGQYRPLLLIASGIQMAGPNLTPETFAEGMRRAVFPNPEHPNKMGAVSFADGSHGMMNDGVEIWWSNTEPPPYTEDSLGTFCYVDDGARRTAGDWPEGGDPFFQPPCHTTRGMG